MTKAQYSKLIKSNRGWGEDLDGVSAEDASRDFARVVLENAEYSEDEIRAYLQIAEDVQDWFGRFVDDLYSVS